MKSKVIGIIAEYNPFHEGHKYQIEETKRITGGEIVVAAISGDFTQRGLPAVYDKWTRAKLAVKSGVDLVVQIPTVYACNSAEYFAKGGVGVLEGLGCVDYLSFGSESGDLGALEEVAQVLTSRYVEIHQGIKVLTKRGCSYPVAREKALKELLSESALRAAGQPNNLLGIEYLKELKTMKPVTILRKGDGYHETATKIRLELEKENSEAFKKTDENYFKLLKYVITTTSSEELEKILSSGEGLGNKAKKVIRYCNSIEELIEKLKSKAYTRTRITRFLTHILLKIHEEDLNIGQDYIRVLGFSEKGAGLLKEVKKGELSSLPILTNINKDGKFDEGVGKRLEIDIRESDVYNIIKELDLYANSEYVKKPYRYFTK